MNSRTKGHDYERQMADKLREIWPECYTTRFKGTLWLDHCGIDLVGTPGYNVQLKAMERTPAYHDILDYMPTGENVNIVIHKRNRKGSVVVMRLEDIMSMLIRHKTDGHKTQTDK
jgi:hypothetical protein